MHDLDKRLRGVDQLSPPDELWAVARDKAATIEPGASAVARARRFTIIAVALLIGLGGVVALTRAFDRDLPAVPPDVTHTPVETPSSDRVIELPPLPSSGVAAMWSRDNNATGVSFVGLDGEVAATIRNAIIYQSGPLRSPDTLVLALDKTGYWLLDADAHELRRITRSRADQLVTSDSGPRLPIPPNSTGEWAWVRRSPDGTELLGQYWQNGYGAFLSECSKPIAMLQGASASAPEPITGQSLGNVQPTNALGWAAPGHAVVEVAVGPCSTSGRFAPGVYIFDGIGQTSQRVRMPTGSYTFQMWSAS
jgi:hypothetical protein